MGLRRSTGDLFALALPAGEAVGRLGCYFNGCCYGEPFDGPWAVLQHGALRHPAQLYSAVVAALTFGFLLWVPRERVGGRFEGPRVGTRASDGYGWRGRLREGDLFRLYLLIFSVTRFGLEFVRWRESTVGGLSPMQWFCLDLVVIALIGLLRRRKDEVPQLRPGV